MFRRKASALPQDPIYGDTLMELGYFINDDGEIRSIQNPRAYFKYFIKRNPRWNDRQLFHFHGAVQTLVHERLQCLDVDKVALPLGTSFHQPHVPIMVSKNLRTAKRIIVLIQEPHNELGILAHRVAGGAGGIDQGSMVCVVKYIQETQPDAGIVIANPGELWWWAEGRRPLTLLSRESIPMKSAAHWGPIDHLEWTNLKAPRNGNEREHVECVFSDVLDAEDMANPHATIHVIALGLGADSIQEFLDAHWIRWQDRVKSYFSVGGMTSKDSIEHSGYLEWMRKRASAFILCSEPLGTLISGPNGNPNTCHYTDFGCPVFASSESALTEMMFIKDYRYVLDKVQEIAAEDAKPGGPGYQHPGCYMECTFIDELKKANEEAERKTEEAWKDANDSTDPAWQGPSIGDILNTFKPKAGENRPPDFEDDSF